MGPRPDQRTLSARERRRRARILRELLRAVAPPLDLLRRIKAQGARSRLPEQAFAGVDHLLAVLETTVLAAVRDLAVLVAGDEPRPGRLARPPPRLGRLWRNLADGARPVIEACKGCAARVSRLFETACAWRDTHGADLIYRLLRALERTLFIVETWAVPAHCVRRG